MSADADAEHAGLVAGTTRPALAAATWLGNQPAPLDTGARRLACGTVALSFSILTPTLNRRDMLAEAMASVRSQNWPEVEHIVADGGSDDGTLALLDGAIDVRVLTGPDTGIYDGLNRAVAAARGDIVGWLNSDDLYAPEAFSSAASLFEANAGLAAVCGGAQIEANGVVERVYPAELVADLSPGAILIGPTLPNAWFFRRSVFERVGGFSLELRYAADSDFMQRFAKLGLPHARARNVSYRYRRHAGSATLRDNNASEALRLDMLQLAEKWRNDADPNVRAAALALEGRCRAGLAASSFARGKIGAAFAHLKHTSAVAHGVSDYLARRLAPGLRRRRLGMAP